jgi:polyisoprenoid-binding protein YceI
VPAKAAPPAPTSAPAAVAANAPATVATTIPASPPASSAPSAAIAAPASSQTAAPKPASAPSDARTFVIVADQSEVTVRVKEQLADLAAMSDAVLSTREIKGQIVVTREGKIIADGSKFTVNLDSLKSDRAQRDNFIKRNTLETSKFSTAELAPTELKLSGPVPVSGDLKGQLLANMTVHGTTRPVSFDLDARLDGSTVKGTAQTNVKITDFDMKIPKVALVLSVEDLVRLQVSFIARTEG